MGDISPLQHRFVLCDTLRKSLERKRYRGKWRSVRGIAEDNYALVQQGGFRLAAVPIRSRTSANLADHCTDTWQHVSKEPLLTEAVQYNSTAAEATRRQYPTTTLCVAHVDTVSAAVALGADTGILNFANAHCPGGSSLDPEESATGTRKSRCIFLCCYIPQIFTRWACARRGLVSVVARAVSGVESV
eukprot:m.921439 g.921439  ORF g.921439 m.921439 type:complete len:188 (-) comp23757_c0_seq23:3575-4138(-)